MAKKAKVRPAPMSAREHVGQLIAWMSQGVYEKEQIIAVALLCALAGENVFLLGPPGTAKSLVASRLKMVFKDGKSFDYLMSRFSTPDEIFGPVSISRLKNEDRYERITAGYLPEAHVVFLDEIWKAGPSIQNTLLTVINEHVFHNGGVAVPTPMKVLIAASNELPAKDEGLEALWDRFMMRMVSNCISGDKEFFKMLKSDAYEIAPLPADLYITDELYAAWQTEAKNIRMPEAVENAIRTLRRLLEDKEKEDGRSLRYYVSDRRWRKAYRLMQMSAFLNGRREINLSDYLLLIHSFWNDVDSIPVVIEAFAESIVAAHKNQLAKVEKSIRQLLSTQSGPMAKSPAPVPEKSGFVEYDYFYYRIENFPDGEAYFAKWDYASLTSTAIDGVKYFDTNRGKYIIHSMNPHRPFDAQTLNATDISRVKLEKWVDGAIIDGTPYRFFRHQTSEAQGDGKPFYHRAKSLVDQFKQCVDDWEKSVDTNFRIGDNIFLSPADISIIDKARKDLSSLFKAVEVKVNNVGQMIK